MIKPKYYCILGFLLLARLNILAQEAVPKKVLFVGNSYTYFWNLPQTVQAMAKTNKVDLTTRQSTSGGVHWGHHWRGERNLNTQSIIKEGDFDALVLQNHSMSTFNRVDSMFHYGQRLSKLGKKKGAQIFLYMTWGREWNPYMQATITKEYTRLAKKLKAKIVPVGPAWERARQLRPNFPLYDEDGSHPSSLGTYLSACVFYGILTNQSPVGLPNRLISKDIDGEKIYLTIQSSESATFCQQVAEDIINKYRNNQRKLNLKSNNEESPLLVTTAKKENWQVVYKTDKTGAKLIGSKQNLIDAIRQGLDVKIGWGFKGTAHSIEHVSTPIWLGVLDEKEVIAHLSPQVLSKTDWDNLSASYNDPSKLKEEWRVVISTNGAFDAVWYDKKTNEQIKRMPQQHPITWLVKGGIGKNATNLPLFQY